MAVRVDVEPTERADADDLAELAQATLTPAELRRFRTIPVGISEFGSQFTVPYGTLFAASVVAVLPIAILVLVFRKAVVSGLTSGAVKG